jgi:hypothetical protein
MKKISFAILFLAFVILSFGQKSVFLEISPMFQNSNLQMNVNYTAWNGKTFKLDHFDYYLSSVELTYDGGQTVLIDSVFLVEPQNHTLFVGNFDITQIEKISFLVGVPKPLNTQSGAEAIDISLYPENHPLSFQSPSMYWGWQAGYMHMIIGGSADHNGDGSLEADFELHNLGNTNQQSIQMNNVIQTNISSEQVNVYINCQVDRWINNIQISTVGISHGEMGVNATIMDNAATQTVFIQPANAGIENTNIHSKTFFQNNQNTLDIYWQELTDLEKIQVLDLNGKTISEFQSSNSSGQFSLENIEKGYYIIHFLNKNAHLIGSLNAIH